jgi:hypothetical protein
MAKDAVFLGLGRHVDSTYYHDDSLYHNNGTLTGFPNPPTGITSGWGWDNTLKKPVLNCDGTDDECLLPTINLGTTYTISAWLKISSGVRTLFGDVNLATRYGFYVDATNWYHSVYDTSQRYVVVTHGGAFWNAWTNFSLVRRETSVSFFTNGNQVGATQTLSANAAQWFNQISRIGNGGLGKFAGSLSDPILLTRALSPSELKLLADPAYSIDYGGLILPVWQRVYAPAVAAPPTGNRRRRVLLAGVPR